MKEFDQKRQLSPEEKAKRLREELSLCQRYYLKKCECGAEKARIPGHSKWCPKYEKY